MDSIGGEVDDEINATAEVSERQILSNLFFVLFIVCCHSNQYEK